MILLDENLNLKKKMGRGDAGGGQAEGERGGGGK